MAGKRILVVDDEPEIVELLTEVLEGEGFEVDSAADGGQALDCIQQKIYDAAIVDFSLPDMNGILLHRQMRQADPELGQRTIFMSGLSQEDENLGYFDAFGSGFLAKPFDVQDAMQALLDVLDKPTD